MRRAIAEWLNFVTGVVDVSEMATERFRKTLQQNKILRVISQIIVLCGKFGDRLQHGIMEDSDNRTKIVELHRLVTNRSEQADHSDGVHDKENWARRDTSYSCRICRTDGSTNPACAEGLAHGRDGVVRRG